MDTILTPLSFMERRTPSIAKVQADADRMYAHARYVIVLDQFGNVKEDRPNRRSDDCVVDCLAVFAPFVYSGTELEKVLVLEIGFRRFVPYTQAEYSPEPPRKRSAGGGRAKNPNFKPTRRQKERIKIQTRIPVAELSESIMLNLLPAIANGIQTCVDDSVSTWTGTMGAKIRWVRSGGELHKFWNKHEMEPEIHCRLPKEATLLCAAASFAGLRWRMEPRGHLAVSAEAMMEMLGSLLRPGRRKGKDLDGNFDDDFVRDSLACFGVAERLKKRIERGYTAQMVAALLDLIGPSESEARRLVEQIGKVFQIPTPESDDALQHYLNLYGERKDLILGRWNVRMYQSLRRVIKKEEYQAERKSKLPYRPHATNSFIFSVIVSKEAQQKMVETYCLHRAQKVETVESVQPIAVLPKIVTLSAHEANDDDIPWFDAPGTQDSRTGTDDEFPS